MRRTISKKDKGRNRIADIGLVLVLALLLSMSMTGGLLAPGAAPATTPITDCGGCHIYNGTGPMPTTSFPVADGTARNTPAGLFPGSHGKHSGTAVTQYAYACTVCHVSNTTNNHRNGYIDMANPLNGNTGAAYSRGTVSFPVSNGSFTPGTCGSVYCHSNASPYNGVNTFTTPTWGATSNCAYCHRGQDTTANMTASGATGTMSAPHVKHIASADAYGQNPNFFCSSCHAITVAAGSNTTLVSGPGMSHVNAVKDVSFDGFAVSTATYSLGAHQCSNVYCHGNGQSAAPANGPITWSLPLPNGPCASCHGNSTTLTSGSHTKHLVSYACNNCHTATASSNTAIGNYANHVNKAVTISLDTTTAAAANATYGGSTRVDAPNVFQKTIATAFGSCTNIRCHNNGQYEWDNTLAQAGNTPTWGTTAGCGACHGNGTYSDYRIAAPLYVSYPTGSKPNAHDKHVDVRTPSANEPQCKHCHASVTATNIAIDGTTPANHANGAYNVVSGSTYSNGDNVSAAQIAVTTSYTFSLKPNTSTCSNVSCHPTGVAGTKAASTTRWDGSYSCTDCHKIDLTQTTTYHHSMNNTQAASYPTTTPQGSATAGTNPTSRTCVMCHVDHNIFSPMLNPNTGALTQPRAMNLRTGITTVPNAASSATYTNTDFVSGSGGVCISCHSARLTKDTVRQVTEASSTMTMTVAASDFSGASHNYLVASTMKSGGAAFNANCVKCHDEQNGEIATFQSNSFGTHDSTVKRLAAPLGNGAPPADYEEQFCFRCHARTIDTATNKTTANKDWYGVANMSTPAEKIYDVVMNNVAYPFGHPVDATAGKHKPADEGLAANNGTLSGTNRHIECTDCHDPHAAQPVGAGPTAGTLTGWTAGTRPAFDTLTDTTKAWTANQWVGYTARITAGTGAGQEGVIYANTATTLSVEFTAAAASGSSYIIFSVGTTNGNTVTNAQLSTWGVIPTWPAQPAPVNWTTDGTSASGAPSPPVDLTTQYNTISTWARTENATIQGYICIKCHSSYAYGTTPPNTPSGVPTGTGAGWVNTVGGAIVQGDKANEFNPNNLGYHPIFARGKNQPITATGDTAGAASYYNTNWPKFTGTVSITTGGAATFTSAIPSTTLPGWFIYAGSATPAQGATTEWFQITAITDSTHVTVTPNPSTAKSGVAFMLTAGLGNNFVPPWGPWSTMRCTDCHESDTTSDPMGPHGSATKYLLKKAIKQTFAWYNGTSVVNITYDPTVTYTGASNLGSRTGSDPYNFCLNCHRMDVYGALNLDMQNKCTATSGATAVGSGWGTGSTNPNVTWFKLSRQSHSPESCGAGGAEAFDSGQGNIYPKWGLICMNCHGGARLGGIHGQNLGIGAGKPGTATYNSGKRLLGGADWSGVIRSTTGAAGSCYQKTYTTTSDSVDTCAWNDNSSGVMSGPANYTYDDTGP